MADLITDEAYKVAAIAYLEMVPFCKRCEKDSAVLLRRCDDCKRLAGEFAAHMLHAAAPLIAARALREEAEERVVIVHSCFKPWCPDCREQRVNQSWRDRLRARAARIERKARP